MRGWKGAFYKELRLFFRGPGWTALLLPVLLLLALRAGLAEPAAYVRPFPIAVRDLDNTMMSRSLLSQMEEIALFSRLIPAEDASDSQLLEAGAAAVVTIPKDFFYALYTMEDCPVAVTLNEDMPLESALFQTMFRSVLGIIQSDQAVGLGVYEFCWGELTEAQAQAMYAETARQLFQDALGRQQVFSSGQAEPPDLAGALERRLTATLLSVLALFLSCSAVKTLPEERELGILPRYQAAGGALASFLAAKFGTVVLLALPVILLLLPAMPAHFPLAALILLFGAFGLVMALSCRARNASAVQRRGSLLLLASLVLGGTLWPLGDGPLRSLSPLTLPYYALLGLEALHRGVSLARLASLLWPVLAMGVAGLGLGCAGLFRSAGPKTGPTPSPVPDIVPERHLRSVPVRLVSLALFQLRAMTGGVRSLLILLCALLLCGGAAATVRSGPPPELRLAVQDLDGTTPSGELVQRLSHQAGLALVFPGEPEEALLLGDAECLLTIGRGYGRALEDGAALPLRLESASSSLSAQGVREIVAGQVTAQLSLLRAPGLAEAQLGRRLTEAERAELMAQINRTEAEMPALYQLETGSGAALPDPFAPGPMSFATLAVLLVLFTAAPWSGADRKPVMVRMGTLPRGRLLLQGGIWLALSALGFLTALAVLLPGGELDGYVLLAAGAYGFCAAGLALALLRLTAMEGRVDGFAPFLGLILCLLGGCFLNLSQVSPMLARLSLLTPPGLALRAAEGMLWADGLLLGGGTALFALSMDR